jgi:hypothetical protein
MTPLIYFGVLLFACLIFGYEMALVEATSYWAKRLAPGNEFAPRGFEQAIMPRASVVRLLALPVFLLGWIVVGLMAFRWYVVAGTLLGTPIVVTAAKHCFPKPKAAFFRGRLQRSLRRKLVSYGRKGDALRAGAVDEILLRFDGL